MAVIKMNLRRNGSHVAVYAMERSSLDQTDADARNIANVSLIFRYVLNSFGAEFQKIKPFVIFLVECIRISQTN